MAAVSTPPCVGQKVRVWTTLSKEESLCALVSWVEASADSGKPTSFDVIYDDSGIEECGISFYRLQEREAWELVEDEPPQEALVIKERGNRIFQNCRDWKSARRQYALALSLVSPPLSVGARVLVLSAKTTSLCMLPAIISDMEVDGSVDLMYEEEFVCWASQDGYGDEGKEDESAVPAASRIATTLNPDSSLLEIQRSCCINLARCCLREKIYGWGIRHASVAATISRLQGASKATSDALVIRSKMLLYANKPVSARKDAMTLGDDPRSVALISEIDSVVRDQRKGNKKMAIEIANWVEQAMTLGQS